MGLAPGLQEGPTGTTTHKVGEGIDDVEDRPPRHDMSRAGWASTAPPPHTAVCRDSPLPGVARRAPLLFPVDEHRGPKAATRAGGRGPGCSPATGPRAGEVAKKVRLKSGVYGRVERGAMVPSVPTLRRICETLCISSDVLLSLDSQAREGRHQLLRPQPASTRSSAASSTSCTAGLRSGWRSCASCWRRPTPTSRT